MRAYSFFFVCACFCVLMRGLRDVVKLFKKPGIVVEDSGMVVVVTLQKDLKKMSATQAGENLGSKLNNTLYKII